MTLIEHLRFATVRHALHRGGKRASRKRKPNTYDWSLSTCDSLHSLQIDTSYNELAKELHNGRLFRLLTKLNMIVERPQVPRNPKPETRNPKPETRNPKELYYGRLLRLLTKLNMRVERPQPGTPAADSSI